MKVGDLVRLKYKRGVKGSFGFIIKRINNPEWGGCRALRRALREHEPDGAYKEIMTNVLEEWKKCERGEANAFAEMW